MNYKPKTPIRWRSWIALAFGKEPYKKHRKYKKKEKVMG